MGPYKLYFDLEGEIFLCNGYAVFKHEKEKLFIYTDMRVNWVSGRENIRMTITIAGGRGYMTAYL